MKEGLCEPQSVTAQTNKYKDKGDIFKKFVEENIDFTQDPKDHMGIKVLYEHYREWHVDTFNNKAPPRTHFKEYLDTTSIDTHKKKGYLGIKIRVSSNEEEEEESC